MIEQRASEMADVPGGGDTGLLVRQYKVSGETVMTEYAVDTATIRELRGVQEQVAKELGQLVEKKDIKLRSLKDLTDDELAELIAEIGESGDDMEYCLT